MNPALSVVIPTVGRPGLLAGALAALAECDPPPAEVVVVDQSATADSEPVVAAAALPLARVVRCAGRGPGLALNVGLRAAGNSLVGVVDDDCVVAPEWVAATVAAMSDEPTGIVCGQVLPEGGDARAVPSTIVLDQPRDYTGQLSCSDLYKGNMACPRDAVLALGGFDESLVCAEDCDFCYRWLRAGQRLRHDPRMVVIHRAWRSPEELERLYVRYYIGQGMFYAKHLRTGDPHVLRFLARDLHGGLRAAAAGRLRGVPRWADQRRGALGGLPRGLARGLFR